MELSLRRRRPLIAIIGAALLLIALVLQLSPAGAATRSPIPLAGDLNAHDPSFTQVGNTWYVLNTGDPAVNGGTIAIKRSTDRHTFVSLGTVWDAIPAWVSAAVPKVTNLWAPEVYHHGGTYYLYYAASSFGSNQSVIGLATNSTLDPSAAGYRWVDRGLVWQSQTSDDYNAIDPGIVSGSDGSPWMVFGSFWSGVRQVRLQWPSGKAAAGQTEPLRLVDRQVPPNAVEAPYMVQHDGRYYLFVSFDFCCRGTDSTYKIAVGRSRSVNGPFYDELGTPLEQGGGTVILSSDGAMVGPGGESISHGLIAYHYYDGDQNGAITLGIRRIHWGPGGWPVLTRLH